MFREFIYYKVSSVCNLIDLFLNVSILNISMLSIGRTKWFKYEFYRGLFVICNHIFGIITLLVQFNLKIWCKSLEYSGRFYWVNRLNIAINRVRKYGHISETTKCPNPYWMNYILLKPSIYRTCVIWIDWNVVP